MNLFDFHCDTLYECCETGAALRENTLAVDRSGAQRYGRYAQFFALFCGAEAPPGQKRQCLLDTPPDARLDRLLQTARQQFDRNRDWLTFCRTAQQLQDAQDAGKTAALLSIEGAELLPDRPDAVQYAYEQGVRLLTLAWNYRSRFACGAAIDEQAGLTAQGRQLVRDCEAVGMLMDVSHLSERGFWDLCEIATRPFVATHSNARVLCDHHRNLRDAQFAEIVRRGGMVGINLYVPFVTNKTHCRLTDVLDHIEHFLGMYGEGHLCLGCDLDGCSLLPDGIERLGDVERLAEEMLRVGYQESTVNGLFYDSLFAFVKKTI